MALIPGTLPSDTCYGTPQDLLELFAQYLDVPAFVLNSKVVFSTSSTGLTADVVWFDTTSANNPVMKIFVSGAWVDHIYTRVNNASNVTLPLGASDYIPVIQSGALKKIAGSFVGRVVQVVEATTATQVTVSANTYTDTTLTASITPTSASNKILVVVNQGYVIGASGAYFGGAGFTLLRDSTVLHQSATDSSGRPYEPYGYTTMHGRQIITYLDSPTTTSSITYKTMARPYDSTVNSMFIRLQQGDVVPTKSFIYLLEVVA